MAGPARSGLPIFELERAGQRGCPVSKVLIVPRLSIYDFSDLAEPAASFGAQRKEFVVDCVRSSPRVTSVVSQLAGADAARGTLA